MTNINSPTLARSISYHIQIDEDQRVLLAAALASILASETLTTETNTETARDLFAMLTELPKEEEECPGVLHGFCL